MGLKKLPNTKHFLLHFKKISYTLLCISLLFAVSSCNNDVNLDWQPRIVSPLVSGELGVFQQPDVEDISDVFLITANDVFGTLRGTIPTGLPALGPFNFTLDPTKISDDDVIEQIGLSNIRITITLRNNMPVTMASGAVLALTNSNSATPFAETTINRTVGPGETATFAVEQSSAVITNTFVATLNNLSTLAEANPVTITDNSQIELSLQFDPPTIDYIDFVPGRTITFETKTDFDTGLDESSDDISGNLIVNIQNQIPINSELAINFLDASDNIIGTVFNPTLALTANQDVTETINSQTIINNLRNATQIQILSQFNPTATNRRIDNTAKLNYKLVADLQVKVKLN